MENNTTEIENTSINGIIAILSKLSFDQAHKVISIVHRTVSNQPDFEEAISSVLDEEILNNEI